MATFWTDARYDQAVKMAGEGYSASQIAVAIGAASRNAVIGKLHRNGVRLNGVVNHYTRESGLVASMRVHGNKDLTGLIAYNAQRKADADARKALEREEKERRRAARLIKISEKRNEWKEGPMPVRVECSPRPWTERKFGECAFPVEGEGADTKSCCNEVYKEAQYCRGHFRVMFAPAPKRGVKAPRSPLNFQNEPRRRRDDVEAELYFAA